MLTTPNPSFDEDMAMFDMLGLKPREAFKAEQEQGHHHHALETTTA
ncbi:hypothetical protein [Paraflavitalea speifideaquila]|nr:hypothetical protein [Paraflavitalea speifideiaquila]